MVVFLGEFQGPPGQPGDDGPPGPQGNPVSIHFNFDDTIIFYYFIRFHKSIYQSIAFTHFIDAPIKVLS